MVRPTIDEPTDVLENRIDVFDLLLRRVRIVVAEIANAAEFMRDAEVQADRFRVADMEVAVRLRRETGVNLRISLLGDVLLDDVAEEITRPRRLRVLLFGCV